jgi:hypothetical protein
MKLICKGSHWQVKDNQLVLDTPEGQQTVKNMVAVLESQIRQTIYEEIIALDFTDNRKQIIKYGLENALLAVQDACAKVVMKGQS